MWVFTQSLSHKALLEKYPWKLTRTICYQWQVYMCIILLQIIKNFHMSVSSYEKPQVFVTHAAKATENKQLFFQHYSKFPQRVLVYIHWKPLWTCPDQDIN